MKLYTEEQVNQILKRAGATVTGSKKQMSEYLMKGLIPIELPDNDEDAGKITLYISGIREESKAVYIVAGAMKYNEWIRSKILNQNK